MASKPGKPLDMSKVAQRVTKRIKRASELPQNQNMLFYGEPGSGKTRLGATAPTPLIVDINDLGTDSVRRDYDPQVYQVDRWQDVNDLYWWLQDGDHQFQTVVIDHTTNLQNLCLAFVLGDEASRDASRDPDMPARQSWGKVGQLMKTQIINYRNLPLNVVFLAQVRSNEIEGEDDEVTIKLGPEVSPSVSKVLNAAVGTIGYLTKQEVWVPVMSKKTPGKVLRKKKEIRRRLMIGDSERYVSKDRNGVFGEYIDAPDLTEMLERIYQGGTDG